MTSLARGPSRPLHKWPPVKSAPANQQYQSTEGTKNTQITNDTISEHTKTQQVP